MRARCHREATLLTAHQVPVVALAQVPGMKPQARAEETPVPAGVLAFHGLAKRLNLVAHLVAAARLKAPDQAKRQEAASLLAPRERQHLQKHPAQVRAVAHLVALAQVGAVAHLVALAVAALLAAALARQTRPVLPVAPLFAPRAATCWWRTLSRVIWFGPKATATSPFAGFANERCQL